MKNSILIAHTKRYRLTVQPVEEVTLDVLQNAVGGYIEPCAPVELKALGYEMLANEEGLLEGLDLNENLLPFFFVGDLVFVKVKGEDFVGLSDNDVSFLTKWIRNVDPDEIELD